MFFIVIVSTAKAELQQQPWHLKNHMGLIKKKKKSQELNKKKKLINKYTENCCSISAGAFSSFLLHFSSESADGWLLEKVAASKSGGAGFH